MKDWMSRYIEFLLASHNCLVIPGLGGFIVSDKFELSNSDTILLPNLTVAFNQDLKYNDGLLYAALQQYEGLTYDKAHQKVSDEVYRIKTELSKNKIFQIGRVGTLELNTENNLFFQPSEEYVHPSNFGLVAVSLNKLQREIEAPAEYVSVRENSKMSYIAVAIALILLFVMPIFNQQEKRVQQASIIETTQKSLSNKFESYIASSQETLSELRSQAEGEDELAVLPQAEKISARTYYVVIGSETSEHRRDALMTKFAKDFSDVSYVETDGRYRIYAASFDDKAIAEEFVIKFREENPKYETAWLYSQKN